jgi:hypothetical protein
MVSTERFEALVIEWRSSADDLRDMGLSQPAAQRDVDADKLEGVITEWLDECLTLDQAALESGYTYNHIQACVSEGKLPNAGERGAPRVRRRDLPMKGGRTETESIAELVR